MIKKLYASKGEPIKQKPDNSYVNKKDCKRRKKPDTEKKDDGKDEKYGKDEKNENDRKKKR